MSNEVIRRSLVTELANRYGIEADRFLSTLKNTAFKVRNQQVSNEQMAALLIVSRQHDLNPFLREIYAFPDKQGGIVPIVSIDGWIKIINSQPELSGIEFRWSDNIVTPDGGKPCPEWCECIIHRRDRDYAVVAPEYLDEVYRPPFVTSRGETVPGPWQTHTKRMLRHKALIQAARLAFGFAGIYDPDEGERIRETQTYEAETVTEPEPESKEPAGKRLRAMLTEPLPADPAGEAMDAEEAAEANIIEEVFDDDAAAEAADYARGEGDDAPDRFGGE